MTTPHPYAHILRGIADGETIQLRNPSNQIYEDWHPNAILSMIGDGDYVQQGIRVKPRTITINGHEVPEPLRAMPEDGWVYWAVFTARNMVCSAPAKIDSTHIQQLLNSGLLFGSEEAVTAFVTAILSITAPKAP